MYGVILLGSCDFTASNYSIGNMIINGNRWNQWLKILISVILQDLELEVGRFKSQLIQKVGFINNHGFKDT